MLLCPCTITTIFDPTTPEKVLHNICVISTLKYHDHKMAYQVNFMVMCYDVGAVELQMRQVLGASIKYIVHDSVPPPCHPPIWGAPYFRLELEKNEIKCGDDTYQRSGMPKSHPYICNLCTELNGEIYHRWKFFSHVL